MTVFVRQPLALPGSAKNLISQSYLPMPGSAIIEHIRIIYSLHILLLTEYLLVKTILPTVESFSTGLPDLKMCLSCLGQKVLHQGWEGGLLGTFVKLVSQSCREMKVICFAGPKCSQRNVRKEMFKDTKKTQNKTSNKLGESVNCCSFAFTKYKTRKT